MKEARSEAKYDSGPETAGEDLMDQIMNAHVDAIAKTVTERMSVGKSAGTQDIAALRDELKSFIVASMSALGATMVSTVSSAAAPMLAAAAGKSNEAVTAQILKEVEARTRGIIDEGVSRMQALTARVTDMIAEDRKEDAAERKAILKALAELAKPRKRTGVVKLPSGEVTMTVTDMMQ